ncbi:MAG: 5'/3'-nucleotidase SurE [Planctomycetes bacterium]|nr:5'/3'-nucleotidase SurE [Planctomycetota bacterium]
MHILLLNDDGIDAPGLVALRGALARFARVSVVAPRYEQSGVGHSITIFKPLAVHVRSNADRRVQAMVEGTPADCVKLALGDLLKKRPDLVISGINLGTNAGINVFYSGTVAGAMEAAFSGVPAMAISLATKQEPDFACAARVAVHLIRKVLPDHCTPGVVFNINIPNLPWEKLRGVVFTRQDSSPYVDSFDRREDPRGQTYYWMRGDMRLRPAGTLWSEADEPPSDVEALRDGYVTITPLQLDLTHYPLLATLKARILPLGKAPKR